MSFEYLMDVILNENLQKGRGHEWTVNEDWEARKLVNGIFQIQTSHEESTYNQLRMRNQQIILGGQIS